MFENDDAHAGMWKKGGLSGRALFLAALVVGRTVDAGHELRDRIARVSASLTSGAKSEVGADPSSVELD